MIDLSCADGCLPCPSRFGVNTTHCPSMSRGFNILNVPVTLGKRQVQSAYAETLASDVACNWLGSRDQVIVASTAALTESEQLTSLQVRVLLSPFDETKPERRRLGIPPDESAKGPILWPYGGPDSHASFS
jgi:hypothetical protein